MLPPRFPWARALAAALAVLPLVACSDSESPSVVNPPFEGDPEEDDPPRPPDETDPEASREKLLEALVDLEQQTSEGLRNADDKLGQALKHDPDNHSARFFLVAVRLITFFDDIAPATTDKNGDEVVDSDDSSPIAGLLQDGGVRVGDGTLTTLEAIEQDDDDLVQVPEEPLDTTPGVGEVQDLLRSLRGLLNRELATLVEIPADYSDVLTITVDEETGPEEIELDYGDVQVMVASLRLLQAGLCVATLFDLSVDLVAGDEELDAFDADVIGSVAPLRLFSGDSPANIVEDQILETTFGPRPGFLNQPDRFDSSRTFLLAEDGDETLIEWHRSLLGFFDALFALEEWTEDDDTEDDLSTAFDEETRCLYDVAEPWILDVHEALSGGDPVVDPLTTFAACDDGSVEEFDFDGGTFRFDLLFSPEPYDGRWFLPDYTLGGPPATEASFPHALENDALRDLVFDTSGQELDAEAFLRLWNDLASLWDDGLYAIEFELEQY